jgi:sulfur carrier protein
MVVTVNGHPREVPQGTTVRQLAAIYNLDVEKVAVEVNRKLVRSDGYDEALAEGDVVEIVTFVGGGS